MQARVHQSLQHAVEVLRRAQGTHAQARAGAGACLGGLAQLEGQHVWRDGHLLEVALPVADVQPRPGVRAGHLLAAPQEHG